jgi:hypothetical protein
MRLNWIIAAGNVMTMNDIQGACSNFFHTHRVIPDTIKMTYHDMSQFMTIMPYKVVTLERGKEYGQFIAIPGGMVELLVMEESDEAVVNINGGSMMVIESTQIDREFEKHVLNKGES